MGRRRQEQVTGKTYEERVKAAQRFSLLDVIKGLRNRLKPDPVFKANFRRDGVFVPKWIPKEIET